MEFIHEPQELKRELDSLRAAAGGGVACDKGFVCAKGTIEASASSRASARRPKRSEAKGRESRGSKPPK